MHRLFATEQWLPFPHELVFAFFANPANLPPLMPAWQKLRIDSLTLRTPPPRPVDTPVFPGVAAGDGTEMTLTARGLPGLPLRGSWLARIEDFRWNQGFCDVQLSGPFAYWRHCHSVYAESRDGREGTLVRDEVRYQLPLDPLSRWAMPLSERAIQSTFSLRQQKASALVAAFAARAEAMR